MKFFIDTANLAQIKEAHESGILEGVTTDPSLMTKAGAAYVWPFIGRIDNSAWDGILLIEQIAHVFSVQGYNTELLAASIRSPNHIVKTAGLGAHVCTARWTSSWACSSIPPSRPGSGQIPRKR